MGIASKGVVDWIWDDGTVENSSTRGKFKSRSRRGSFLGSALCSCVLPHSVGFVNFWPYRGCPAMVYLFFYAS